MKMNMKLLAIVTGLVCCVFLVWFSRTIQGGERTYEIQPQITLPEYRTDTARAIDAYERLMEQYMGLSERHLISISTDIKSVRKKLDSIDGKLRKLSSRMARIEKALGLEESKAVMSERPQFKGIEKGVGKKPSPAVVD